MKTIYENYEKLLALANHDLRQAAACISMIMETSLDPMVILDVKGKITHINAALEAMIGLSRDSIIDTKFSSYCTNPEILNGIFETVQKTGLSGGNLVEIATNSNSTTQVLFNSIRYDGIDDGMVLGMLVVARDMTEINRHVPAVNLSLT
jgi:PAS domain S-box-containing protein